MYIIGTKAKIHPQSGNIRRYVQYIRINIISNLWNQTTDIYRISRAKLEALRSKLLLKLCKRVLLFLQHPF